MILFDWSSGFYKVDIYMIGSDNNLNGSFILKIQMYNRLTFATEKMT